jgi:hypothetical protein
LYPGWWLMRSARAAAGGCGKINAAIFDVLPVSAHRDLAN